MRNQSHRFPDIDKLYIFGAGASGREMAWIAQEAWGDCVRIAFVVNHPKYLKGRVDGHPVHLLSHVRPCRSSGFIAAVGDPTVRQKIVMECSAADLRPVTLLHPEAQHSTRVEIGEGSVMAPATVLTTNVKIGKHVHINVGSSISHDSVIEDFVTISPGVRIAGHVHVHRGAFIGIGAVISNGTQSHPIVVGRDSVVAAGACVIASVQEGTMVAGVPAIRKT